MKEIRIALGEVDFTNVCKTGTIVYGTGYNKLTVYITKRDMKELAAGDILEKEVEGQTFKIILSDIGLEMIKEILRRSPVFSDLYYEI